MIDIQTLIIVGGLVVNAIAVIWNIVETFRLHKQTKELQESNAKLQSEVNRLSVHMNQEIIRLNRVNELTRDMYRNVSRLHHKLDLSVDNEGADKLNVLAMDELLNEAADSLVTYHSSHLEMKAIATVIGDPELLERIDELRSNVLIFDPKESKAARQKCQRAFRKHTSAVHEKVYELLQEVSDST